MNYPTDSGCPLCASCMVCIFQVVFARGPVLLIVLALAAGASAAWCWCWLSATLCFLLLAPQAFAPQGAEEDSFGEETRATSNIEAGYQVPRDPCLHPSIAVFAAKQLKFTETVIGKLPYQGDCPIGMESSTATTQLNQPPSFQATNNTLVICTFRCICFPTIYQFYQTVFSIIG
jgi:hypothetical protein